MSTLSGIINPWSKSMQDATYFWVYLLICLGRAASKIAQFPLVVASKKHVLRFDVSVRDRWLLGMHVGQPLDNICRDQDHFRFGKTFGTLISSILDQIEQIASLAELLKHEDFFVARVTALEGMLALFKQSHDVRVLTELTGCITFVFKMVFSCLVSTHYAHLFQSEKVVIAKSLHFIYVCVGTISYELDDTILGAIEIHDTISERKWRSLHHPASLLASWFYIPGMISSLAIINYFPGPSNLLFA